jgi:hypothetical protein
MKKYMMATKAIHKLGDISSDEPDLCYIHREDDENYIGNWVTGFGLINVKFPKATTRELTPKEIEYFNSQYIQLSDLPPVKLNVGDSAKAARDTVVLKMLEVKPL